MRHFKRTALLGAAVCFCVPATAQLLDQSRVDDNGNVNVSNGVIARSLEDQIGAGRGDEFTPSSSIYLINRDPARSIRRGRQLFQRKFSSAEGQGPRINAASTGDVTQNRGLRAGMVDSCAGCHGRPKGSAGVGGTVATEPDTRDAPHLFALGIVEQLANEMTQDLRSIRTTVIAQATSGGSGVDCAVAGTNTWAGNYQVDFTVTNNGSETTDGWSVTIAFDQTAEIYNYWNVNIPNPNDTNVTATNVSYNANMAPGETLTFGVQGTQDGDFQVPTCSGTGGGGGSSVTMQLTTKGVNFGSITANTNGSVDTSQVDGVDDDLRVKPFFHDGVTISMREFIIGAFKAEMGMEVADPVLCAATDPNNPQTVVSPAGFVFNPELDDFERPPVCDPNVDGDGDGVTNEVHPALVDHIEFYLLNYFKPGQYQVTQRAQQGLQLMNSIGCTGCHVQDLTIDSDRRVADVETVYDPANGIFNDLFATASTLFHPEDDGGEFPLIVPNEEAFVVENFFSDLKRHDLGSVLPRASI